MFPSIHFIPLPISLIIGLGLQGVGEGLATQMKKWSPRIFLTLKIGRLFYKTEEQMYMEKNIKMYCPINDIQIICDKETLTPK